VAAPAVVSVALDRRANTAPAAYSSLDRDIVELLADAGADHADRLGDHPLVISRNEPPYTMYRETLAFALIERGVDVRFPLTSRFFVHDDHLVDRDRLEGGLVLVVDAALPSDAPDGELIAEARLDPDEPTLDLDAYRELVATAEAAREVRLGPEVTGSLGPDERTLVAAAFRAVVDDPERAVLDTSVLEFVAGHPALVEPALDPDAAARLLASIEDLGDGWDPDGAAGIRLFLVDREEMIDFAGTNELGRP
jgi:hypothetical protein